MEKESEKRYQEFISASKEADDVYHTLALKFGLSDSAMWILCTIIFIWRRLPVTGGTRLFLSQQKGKTL